MAGPLVITLAVKDMPEVLAELRHEMASLLREAAASEPLPQVSSRLRTVALAFEAGQREGALGQ